MSERAAPLAGPRIAIARRLEAIGTEAASGYARFIQAGEDGRIPCWGAITERFDSDFPTDEERVRVLDSLIEEGDRRPLYLFIHLARSRPSLLEKLVERARRLPDSVQRVLIALPETSELVRSRLKQFSAPIQSAYRNEPQSLQRDQERFENRIRELLAFKFYIPDVGDAREERPVSEETQ
jgi:hypothetical protein